MSTEDIASGAKPAAVARRLLAELQDQPLAPQPKAKPEPTPEQAPKEQRSFDVIQYPQKNWRNAPGSRCSPADGSQEKNREKKKSDMEAQYERRSNGWMLANQSHRFCA